MPNTEAVTKAAQTANLLCQDLREALHDATAIEALVLIPLIAKAATLEMDIKALDAAKREAK